MGKDRRDTTLAFHVEDKELQALYSLLASISQLTTSIGLPTGSTTSGGAAGPRPTAPPIFNYAAPAGPSPNVSAPGGGPSPAALGGTPVSGGPGSYWSGAGNPGGLFSGIFGQGGNPTPPPQYSPAPTTPMNSSPPMFAPQNLTGPTVFNLSGNVTINVSGTATINAPTASTGGSGSGGTTPGAPPSPTPPQPPNVPPVWPNLRRPSGGGWQSFLPWGQAGIGSYLGQQASRFAQPMLAESRLYAGLHITSQEDIEASHWRTGGVLGGGTIGAAIGYLVGGPPGAAIGYGVGSGIGNGIGDIEAEKLERQKQIRLAAQRAGTGAGISSQEINAAFHDITPSGFNTSDVERHGVAVPKNPIFRWISDQFLGMKFGSGQFRDVFEQQTVGALGTVAPSLLTDKSFLRSLLPDYRRAPELFGTSLGAYASEISQNPLLAGSYSQLLSSHTLNRDEIGRLAVIAAQKGDLEEARNLANLATGTKHNYGQDITGTHLRFQRARGLFEEGESGFGVNRAQSGYLASLGRGAAAGNALLGGMGDARQMVTAAQQEVDYWQNTVATRSPETRAVAQQELNKARVQLVQAQQQASTLRGTAGELRYGEVSAIASSRQRSAQSRLGTLQETSLYGNPMEALYSDIEGAMQQKIAGLRELVKTYTDEGRGQEAIAPLKAEIEETQQAIVRMTIEKTRRAFEDSRVVPQTNFEIAGERLRGMRSTGQIYGPTMQGEFNQQRTTQSQIVDSYRRQYEDARARYGEDSPITQGVKREYETQKVNQAVLPFQQIEEKYAGINSVVGNVGSVYGSQSNMALRQGGGSAAALPYQMQQYGTSQTGISVAQARLRDDMAAGAGIEILMRDRAAIQQAQEQSLGVRQSMADVVMPSRFNIEEMQAEGKLRRMQESWTEPGNMFDQYKTLYQHSQQRVNAIDQRERMLDQAGLLDDGMRERLAREREDAKQQSFQYREQMESGWIDRLVSRSISAPSFSARAKPTLSEAASELEYGQSKEEFRQAREFGFVSKRGYDYEKNRGFTTAGMNNTELFPGDIGMMAVMGKRGSKSTATQSDHDMPSADNLAGKMGLGDESDAATEDTQQQILQAIQRLIKVTEQKSSGGMGSSGPSALGHLGVGQSNQTAALGAGRGDSRPPR